MTGGGGGQRALYPPPPPLPHFPNVIILGEIRATFEQISGRIRAQISVKIDSQEDLIASHVSLPRYWK